MGTKCQDHVDVFSSVDAGSGVGFRTRAGGVGSGYRSFRVVTDVCVLVSIEFGSLAVEEVVLAERL